ncbi:MAG: orotidine-5'-phosphate decarboxylase [Desulfobulbaceae bacterium]|jgi:orotidine-5'-phosphate decarboxylase|nr:orotidine-5'-phosphate decarboxylase [Desulfobulbaceae bacterium]PLX50349.1 MAG: orotidine-5'-phosphate decarboxylase [Desulfobulbaceae bacterium]
MKDIPVNERIILALDVDSPEQAKELVKKTESHLNFYKVGLQLFMASWFEIVDWLSARGHKVMVDLKFFDIPETVRLAVAQLNNRGVTFATIHGNDPIIRAAVEAKGDLALLAVTVLTSFDQEDMQAMGMTQSIEDLVYFRARRALELGCDGVVSSGLEAKRLRDRLGVKLLIVTPGIRPGANIYDQQDDQQRIVTARQAIADGADYLVVGRPITKAAEPIEVINMLQDEIRQGLEA